MDSSTKGLAALHSEMAEKLKELGFGHESIKVFGAIRTNVHITCVSKKTAGMWASALYKVFGKQASVVETMWPAAKNLGTVLNPTVRRGFLIVVRS